MKRKTISDWQGKDPMDCYECNYEPYYTNNCDSEPISIGFIIGMVIMLGNIFLLFYFLTYNY